MPLAIGGTVPTFLPEAFTAKLIVTPKDDERSSLSKEASSLVHNIAQNENESFILFALYDTLLPELVSGSLRVS